MTFFGALAGGFVGTVVLTTALSACTALRLTRIDLPFLLGTAFTANRTRARALGYVLHFLAGFSFASVYYLGFRALGESNWWLGGLFGALHGLFAATALVSVLLPLVHPRMGSDATGAQSSPLLEPPGFLMLNYGASTPALTVAIHIVYGSIVGLFAGGSG